MIQIFPESEITQSTNMRTFHVEEIIEEINIYYLSPKVVSYFDERRSMRDFNFEMLTKKRKA